MIIKMALDSIAIRALTAEFAEQLQTGKVDKIHQPERDQITLQIRTKTGNVKLLLSASSANPRAHLTEISQTNPLSAPNFCMLLRKHLAGGKIIDIRQPDFERVIDFCIESYTELGDLTTKHLIIEIMGRHSNIILTDHDGRIMDSIKHINSMVSSLRQVMPGMQYASPPSQGKLNPLTVKREDIDNALDFSGDTRLDKLIIQAFTGISPIVSRELSYRSTNEVDIIASKLQSLGRQRVCDVLWQMFEDIKSNVYKPCIIYDISSGKPQDFCAVDIMQYQNAARVEYPSSLNATVDMFFEQRDASERKKQRAADLVKLVNNNIDRCAKKLIVLSQTIDEAKDKDTYKIYADLLTANLYRIEDGQKAVTIENFYSEELSSMVIPLDIALTPGENAQRYYKKYNKTKIAEVAATAQMELANAEMVYLESIMQSCSMANTDADLLDIKEELRAGGYINSRASGKKDKKQKGSQPLHFVSSDGFDIYCGKNNLQNDQLTLRFANSLDLWFHTKSFAGSHTVIKLGTDKNVPERTILEAAMIAAYHSSAKESSKVPVDYTQIKNVKKPSGAKPGMVIYDYYNTIYVTPNAEAVAELALL